MLLVFFVLALASASLALDNGVARTPPMGWLSWERYRCNVNCTGDPDNCISANLYMAMADHLVSDGYADVGYEYVNIDDCWSLTTRDANGNQVPDPTRFPQGISGLADYVHGLGLKLGLYSDIGTHTCGGYTGMQGYFEQDSNTFASWGIDSLKVDGCYGNYADYNVSYPLLGSYLLATGRPILYSCSWPAYHGDLPVQYKLMAAHCNIWRNFDDIQDEWSSVAGIIEYWGSAGGVDYETFVDVARPGAFNDADMLIIGNSPFTLDQEQTQFAMWAIMASPLLMSNDLRNMTPGSVQILQNTEIIAVNQDPIGKQGRRISSVNGLQVWKRDLFDYGVAVVLYNSNNSGVSDITFRFEDVGFDNVTQVAVRDLINHVELGVFVDSYTGSNINPNAVQMFKLQLANN